MVITGSSNEKIKHLRALYKDGKFRKEMREFVVEGETIVNDMPPERIKRLFIREKDAEKFLELTNGREFYILSDRLFDSIADTRSPSGIIAVSDIAPTEKISGDKVLLLCGVSDPGNVGTIVRTACAAGIRDIISVDSADLYSPKTVRATMGGIFGVNFLNVDIVSALDMLEEYDILALDMNGKNIFEYERKGKIAIAIGNEAHGIPDAVKSRAKEMISIPMVKNSVESLNASVAAGIAIYLI